jgi:BlaI family penicillinase repressor
MTFSNPSGNPKIIAITDAELPIMKSLWARGKATSPEIFSGIPGNKNTLKTLLLRLVQKGAVETEEINQRNFLYFAAVSEKDYIAAQRTSFLKKVFDGSSEKMLLNFVKEERISREALRQLIDLVEEE